MLVNIHHDSAREHNRLLVAGIASIVVIALLVGLSIAIYDKKFASVTMVTVKADRAGLQLAKFGDVRVHGALVGQVRSVSDDGQQASIQLALDPDAAKSIPENVSVQILPTTLFGQKYVALVPPDAPVGELQDGDVIPADRVQTNVELSRVLANLFPLLRAVRPADLNATLSALATALEGRGNQIGETMDQLGTYVDAIGGHLPTLRKDLIALADVSDAYDDAAPDLLNVLDNVTVTSRTIGQMKDQLDVFFSDLGGLADTSTRILRENAQNLIRVGQVNEPITALLADYSPEFPCLIEGAARYAPILSKTFEGGLGQAVHRVLPAAVPELRPARQHRVRRGRSRSVVPRRPPALPGARTGVPDGRRLGHRREPAAEPDPDVRHPAARLPQPHRRLHRQSRRPEDRQRAAREPDRRRPGLLRRARLDALRPARPPRTEGRGMTDWRKSVGGDTTAKLRHRRNAATTAAAIKLGIFTLVSVFVTALLTIIMGNIGLGDTREYHAIFTSASSLEPGDDVRVAGVNVGEVKSVDHYQRTMAEVTFTADSEVQLTTQSRAEIRFLNLIGDRYLALESGDPGPLAEPLAEDDTIDVQHTSPALDLTVLFDGFKPLFEALAPDQVNDLSMNLVQVLQGEGGTIRGLLEHTASLTSSLADRDKLIGSVVHNLTQTLDTVDQHRKQLSDLVIQLRDWMRNLAADRDTIGSSLDNISELTEVVADLLQRGRPLLKSDIADLRDLAKLLNKPGQRAEIVDLLDRMPEMMRDQTRTGTYGSWYQYYICGAQVKITLPLISNLPIIKRIQDYLTSYQFKSRAPRCQR